MAEKTNSRDAVAAAFLEGKPLHAGAAMFTDGETVWSYGHHYTLAYRRTDGSGYSVNETPYILPNGDKSRTTMQHAGAVKRALKAAGVQPSNETHDGDKYTYRVWR
jgi:hypothetical protein